MIWTDECAVNVGGAAGNLWVTRRPGEEYESDCIQPTFRKLSLCMIWGAITGKEKGPMIVWDKENWGNITAKAYIQHVVPTVHEFWQSNEEYLLIEDGATAH